MNSEIFTVHAENTQINGDNRKRYPLKMAWVHEIKIFYEQSAEGGF
jgi:hypothetical protein